MAGRERAVATLPKLIRSLRNQPPKPKVSMPITHQPHNQMLPSLRRAFSLYDQINIIDNVPEDQLRFQRYTDTGFTVNGVDYEGSLLSVVFPSSKLCVLYQILILGCGRNIVPVDPELKRFIRSTGMKLEVLDSRNAISTYNILNEEGRIVAAALIPYGVSS
ncbi:hypothetical protein F8388_016977 [Cannabis sativa]|uniref:NADH dehydrogenase [ubiquinone] 1 alpha subcomplex assembly factor 3 n=1 Tax=Cannabis sativa TaxID=3483 RepID=A0A7J6E418_CANSA|nr:hypothetical protein F8388_016977 [Cannabis sativa]